MAIETKNGSNPKNRNNNNEVMNDWTLRIMTRVLAFGIAAIIFVSLYTALKGSPNRGLFPVLGLSLGIAFAATLAGGFFGFLFGIPKSLQKASAQLPSTTGPLLREGVSSQSKLYGGNTNLEEISDWLTKIIVGVSLIQLTKLMGFYNSSCRTLAKSFKNYMSSEFGFTYSGSLIIFFSICGFLIVYLWARIYFLKQLNELEKALADVVGKVVDKAISEQDIKNSLEKAERSIDDFNKERNKITLQESVPEIKTIVETAKAGPVTVLNDCQKNRWGGSKTNGAYSVEASVVQDMNESDRYNVTVNVSTSDPSGSPIQGKVYFFLHDTYFPQSIVVITAVNNSATLSFDSYEAFTFGVVLNDGLIKMELDLNIEPNVPAKYKYPEKLETIEELKSNLDELKEQLKNISNV